MIKHIIEVLHYIKVQLSVLVFHWFPGFLHPLFPKKTLGICGTSFLYRPDVLLVTHTTVKVKRLKGQILI